MKVALIGAAGNIGSKILAEALARGHQVTAVVRHPEKLTPQAKLAITSGEASDEAGLAKAIGGHDAVINAVRFSVMNPQILIAAVKRAGVKRLLVVGGAGSLEASPGLLVIDTPSFPAAAKHEAGAGREFLKVLRGETELNWTFLSPSAVIAPGERTGKFRLGKDQLLVGANGESKISREDYAVAMIDELENPKHPRQRFTVGY
jgi:hypothetical protein